MSEQEYANTFLLALKNDYKFFDVIQHAAMAYIESPFFFWVILVLLMNSKNWKRPVMLILIVHWFLRSTGDLISKYTKIETKPYFPDRVFVGIGIANVFWMAGEMVGDWYLYVRTKALINDKTKLRISFYLCIIYNLIKIFSIYNFFYEHKQSVDQMNAMIKMMQEHPELAAAGGAGAPQQNTTYGLRWWYIVTSIQSASFFYDLSVIICLKKNLFNRLHDSTFGKGSFVDKFIRVSEYRIFVSMIATLIFLPILLTYIVFLVKFSHANQMDDASMDSIRQAILNINFTLMYIDQILLKSYVNREKNKTYNNLSSSKNKSSSNLQINTFTGSSNNFSYSSNGYTPSSGFNSSNITSGGYSSTGGFSAAHALASSNSHAIPIISDNYRNTTTPTAYGSMTKDSFRNQGPSHNVIALDSSYYRQKIAKFNEENSNNMDDDDRYLINKNYTNKKVLPDNGVSNMKSYDYYNY
ncbi:hypothetical protein PIROE2DRAFT_1429 [Piromyces sp. E2]|nr:hypothetical protein PIROE2DRAFT_1429 [Piromyces sp. E2]|eukprot:OUM70543.1 hypothetical protein PIROE2DRAFT_1429 [Piromyces sp. E2]